jgi:hypothetical protein
VWQLRRSRLKQTGASRRESFARRLTRRRDHQDRQPVVQRSSRADILVVVIGPQYSLSVDLRACHTNVVRHVSIRGAQSNNGEIVLFCDLRPFLVLVSGRPLRHDNSTDSRNARSAGSPWQVVAVQSTCSSSNLDQPFCPWNQNANASYFRTVPWLGVGLERISSPG